MLRSEFATNVFAVQLFALTACVDAPLTSAPSSFSSVSKPLVSSKTLETRPSAPLLSVFSVTSVTTVRTQSRTKSTNEVANHS
jgi:hypothetical protein|eukprot:COSAG06_NODE_941_length_11384_cov_4.377492_2_plen_83_part_00